MPALVLSLAVEYGDMVIQMHNMELINFSKFWHKI